MFNFNYEMLFVIAVILYCPERGRHNIATSSVLQSQCSTFTSQRACLSNQLLNLKIALITVRMWFARHAICQCFLNYMRSIFATFFLKQMRTLDQIVASTETSDNSHVQLRDIWLNDSDRNCDRLVSELGLLWVFIFSKCQYYFDELRHATKE